MPQRPRRLTLALALALAGASGCKQLRERAERAVTAPAPDDDLREAAPRPAGPGLAPGRYRIVDLRVEVAPARGSHDPWDDPPGAEPDPVITLRVDSKQVARCAAVDALQVRCRPDADVLVDARTTIELEAWDDDELVDDRIGTATLADPSSWGTAMELPMVSHGRLHASLWLAAAPSWWALHRARVLGLAAGIAAALLVVGGFRRRLLAPDPALPAPSPLPRCAHCAALRFPGAVSCRHCGAPA